MVSFVILYSIALFAVALIAKSYFRSSSSASCTFHSRFPDSSEQSRLLAENSYLRQQLHDLEQRLEVADSSRQPLTPQVIAAKPLRGHNVLSLKNQSVFENEQKFLDLSSESFQSQNLFDCLLTNSSSWSCRIAPPTITVVIAFPPKQLPLVLSNVASWNEQHFFPCANTSHAALVDLLFYVSRANSTVVDAIERLVQQSTARHCFASIEIRDANVAEKDDVYGEGTLTQWYSVWENKQILKRNTDYMLWMEPDLRPIRSFWLTELLLQLAVSPHPFWIRGSVPRYPENGDYHLNGNAIYQYKDERFKRFVVNSKGAFKEYKSFDQSLYAHLMNNFKLTQLYGHFFQKTDFIQNRGYEDMSLELFLKKNPNTYLVHGKGIVNTLKKDRGI